MSRIDKIYETRNKVYEELKNSGERGEELSLTIISMYLQEISDTLALMYDKEENK